jgi:hypothetical protein
MNIRMNGPFDDEIVGWTGRCVSEWKKNMFKLPDTVHKIRLDGQFEELNWSDMTETFTRSDTS